MKKLLVLINIIILSACSDKPTENGLWQISLKLKNQDLDFVFEIHSNKGVIYNGVEQITLKREKKNHKMIFPITNYHAALEMEFKDSKLTGHWIKYDRTPTYQVALTAKRISEFPKIKELPKSFPRKWKIDFLKNDTVDNSGILLISKNSQGEFASVLTTTGDYRYLTPHLTDQEIIFSGFDGIFAFKIKGNIKEDTMKGIMYAGQSFSQDFIAKTNESFELQDPNSITQITPKSLNICLPNLKDQKICLNTFSKKIKIIQLFGSWCPNCIDETKFLLEYKKQNPNKNIEYFIISFEKSLDKKSALKVLKKTKKMYNIDYPILVGSYTAKTKVNDVLTGIENFNAFPTMIIIDHKGVIQKVHSGFNGPATGIYYERFKDEFDALIKKIQKF